MLLGGLRKAMSTRSSPGSGLRGARVIPVRPSPGTVMLHRRRMTEGVPPRFEVRVQAKAKAKAKAQAKVQVQVQEWA